VYIFIHTPDYTYIHISNPNPHKTYTKYTNTGYSGIIASNCSPKKVAEAAAQDAERCVLFLGGGFVYVYILYQIHTHPFSSHTHETPQNKPTNNSSHTHIQHPPLNHPNTNRLCRAALGAAPPIRIIGKDEDIFTYVPSHLYYMVVETLKVGFICIIYYVGKCVCEPKNGRRRTHRTQHTHTHIYIYI
jgi:hypothetical protein